MINVLIKYVFNNNNKAEKAKEEHEDEQKQIGFITLINNLNSIYNKNTKLMLDYVIYYI